MALRGPFRRPLSVPVPVCLRLCVCVCLCAPLGRLIDAARSCGRFCAGVCAYEDPTGRRSPQKASFRVRTCTSATPRGCQSAPALRRLHTAAPPREGKPVGPKAPLSPPPHTRRRLLTRL